jgi:hypothetical protein
MLSPTTVVTASNLLSISARSATVILSMVTMTREWCSIGVSMLQYFTRQVTPAWP